MYYAIVDAIAPYRKAIVAALATALIGYLSRHGLNVSVDNQEILRVVIDAAIGSILVYSVPNRQKNVQS